MSRRGVEDGRILQLFAWLFGTRWLQRWQADWERAHPEAPRFRERGFTLRVTLWCLIWQRLRRGASQDQVMGQVSSGKCDGLGPRRRGKLSRRLQSHHTSAYNQARQRLPVALVQAALGLLRSRLLGWVGGGRGGGAAQRRVRLWLDGSTVRVLANRELAARFAPARTRKGDTDWCVLRVCVAFCARCGAALYATLGSQYVSEQAMAWELMGQAAVDTLWIGDRNFGVWSVVARAVQCRQEVLVRLTRDRARALAGPGRRGRQGDHRVRWRPSRHSQIPEGCTVSEVEGRLIQVRVRRGRRWVRLWLFTTLVDASVYPVELLVQWYGQRWGAELNFRTVKTHLGMGELVVLSPEMAEREFYVGLLAYNLVRTLMWQSAQASGTDPQALSFGRACTRIVEWIELWSLSEPVSALTAPRWLRRIRQQIARCLLPQRRTPRPSEVRLVRRRPPSKFPEFWGSRRAARCKANRLAARQHKGMQAALFKDA
jgi:hypothetical protein